MNTQEITLAILAGGEGSRMGHPKGELLVGGKPILAYLLDQMTWPGPTLLVTAPGREHPPAWERFDREVIDPVAGQGPLRGVLTAIESCATENIAIATVDMPGINREVLDWLVNEFASRTPAGVMCVRGDGMVEPFPCVMRRGLEGVIRARFARGERSMRRGICDAVVAVPCPEAWAAAMWTNLNNPDDLNGFA